MGLRRRVAAVDNSLPERHHRGARPDSGVRARSWALAGTGSGRCAQPDGRAAAHDAFFCRHGRRVAEAERYHLDLRHPAARAHLDTTVDRLVQDFGVGYFKFDYNINPGPGTDVGGTSAGAGLLGHNQPSWIGWMGCSTGTQS